MRFHSAALLAALATAPLCTEHRKVGQRWRGGGEMRTQQSNWDDGGGRGWHRASAYWWWWGMMAFDGVSNGRQQDKKQQAFDRHSDGLGWGGGKARAAEIAIDSGGLTAGGCVWRGLWTAKMAGIWWRRWHSMAGTMADCEVVVRRWGQRGQCRHNNQTEVAAAAAGGWSQRRQQAAMATGGSSRQWQWQRHLRQQWWQAATVVTTGYGGEGKSSSSRAEWLCVCVLIAAVPPVKPYAFVGQNSQKLAKDTPVWRTFTHSSNSPRRK